MNIIDENKFYYVNVDLIFAFTLLSSLSNEIGDS